MSTHLILVERSADWRPGFPDLPVVPVRDYLAAPDYVRLRQAKIINLCRSYRYLGLGYYGGLLGEARGHRVLPSVRTMTDLGNWAITMLGIEDLAAPVQRALRNAEPDAGERIAIDLYFGQPQIPALTELGRDLFDVFPCPLLRVQFRHRGHWQIAGLRALGLDAVPHAPDDEARFGEALLAHLGRRWRRHRVRRPARYDLAILHEPGEQLAPSNAAALANFSRLGRKLGVEVELIERRDYTRLPEYDALFIRTTTNIDHYTYRFAKKAESEHMVVIDDADSIVRCTNKVFLAELLSSHKIPAPRTHVLQRGALGDLPATIDYPVVLKIPDGAFSRGVHKAEDAESFRRIAKALFAESSLILAQEFLYTEFDWRIGVLDRTPLFAVQYLMSRDHWQIVRHGPAGEAEEGGFRPAALAEVPGAVVDVALRAANRIGNGLYGVDVKQNARGVYVIEVNDNPNLDAGVEDSVIGEALYTRILGEFVRRLDERKGLAAL